MDDEIRSSTNSRRRSVPSTASSSPFDPATASTAPSQKNRPITAARCATRFSSGESRSRRARITACTLSGRSTARISSRADQRPPSCTSRRSSIRWRMISSRKNGFPSERARMPRRVTSGSESTSSSSETSFELSSALSASSGRALKLRRPPPQSGLWRSRSGRDVQTNRIWPSRRSASSSRMSSICGSAQCRSSITATTGARRASEASSARHALTSSRCRSRGSSVRMASCSTFNVEASAAAVRSVVTSASTSPSTS